MSQSPLAKSPSHDEKLRPDLFEELPKSSEAEVRPRLSVGSGTHFGGLHPPPSYQSARIHPHSKLASHHGAAVIEGGTVALSAFVHCFRPLLSSTVFVHCFRPPFSSTAFVHCFRPPLRPPLRPLLRSPLCPSLCPLLCPVVHATCCAYKHLLIHQRSQVK